MINNQETQEYNLVIIQPTGYIHSLGFIDQARYFRYQLAILGKTASITKNRLRRNSINIIFGAHLGFDASLKETHTCIFVNLEQLGSNGSQQTASYINLLKSSHVIEYDSKNLISYSSEPSKIPIITFGYAPYLDKQTCKLEDRPIDILFFGSINERRKSIIDRIESTGISVSVFDHPVYGPERDEYITQSKAVLNCPFYDSNMFEQARVSQCLSLGTPIISELNPTSQPPIIFQSSVEWVENANLEKYFLQRFLTTSWFTDVSKQLSFFRKQNTSSDFTKLILYCKEASSHQYINTIKAPEKATKINLGSGKDYKSGWLNIDVIESAQPDVLLDLGNQQQFPIKVVSITGNQITLDRSQISHIYANNVLEHVPNLTVLMSNCLELLKLDGILEIEVPYEKSLTAWQDPTHLRAMNENSWIYYTDWFWYLGWFEFRFMVKQFNWLDIRLQPCQNENASFMRVLLVKVESTPHERSIARAMRADFGGIPLDTLVYQKNI